MLCMCQFEHDMTNELEGTTVDGLAGSQLISGVAQMIDSDEDPLCIWHVHVKVDPGSGAYQKLLTLPVRLVSFRCSAQGLSTRSSSSAHPTHSLLRLCSLC